MIKNISILFFIFSVCNSVFCQDLTDQHKIFHTYGFKYKLNKKTDITTSYTGIGEMKDFHFTYHDVGLNITRDIAKKSKVGVGFDWITIQERDDSNFSNYFRSNVEYALNTRYKKVDITHEIGAEFYIPKFNKFQYRWIYSFEMTYRKSFTKWKIRPYSKIKIYYYGNGKYIDYYDDERNLIAKKSPNDIHRWRWYTGFKLRPHRQLSIVLSYFWNEEFNAGIFKNSDINIYNKSRTVIKYPYNSYGAINLAFNYTIKTKKKAKSDKDQQQDAETIE